MFNDDDWDAPVQNEEIDRTAARNGLFIFVISILLYALAIWGTTQILANNDVISRSIEWSDCYILAAIYQSWRLLHSTLWDRD